MHTSLAQPRDGVRTIGLRSERGVPASGVPGSAGVATSAAGDEPAAFRPRRRGDEREAGVPGDAGEDMCDVFCARANATTARQRHASMLCRTSNTRRQNKIDKMNAGAAAHKTIRNEATWGHTSLGWFSRLLEM